MIRVLGFMRLFPPSASRAATSVNHGSAEVYLQSAINVTIFRNTAGSSMEIVRLRRRARVQRLDVLRLH
jgi:hypothetical protein